MISMYIHIHFIFHNNNNCITAQKNHGECGLLKYVTGLENKFSMYKCFYNYPKMEH